MRRMATAPTKMPYFSSLCSCFFWTLITNGVRSGTTAVKPYRCDYGALSEETVNTACAKK